MDNFDAFLVPFHAIKFSAGCLVKSRKVNVTQIDATKSRKVDFIFYDYAKSITHNHLQVAVGRVVGTQCRFLAHA